MALQNSIYAPIPLEVVNGGTGNSTELTNGQFWIGNTGNIPSIGTISAGSGISVTNGAGSITINASQNPWVLASSVTPTTLVPFTNYFAPNGSSFIFPTSPTFGDMYTICSLNGNAFTVSFTGSPGTPAVSYGNQNFNNSITSQSSFFGSITFVCSSTYPTPNNLFKVLSPFGTFTGS